MSGVPRLKTLANQIVSVSVSDSVSPPRPPRLYSPRPAEADVPSFSLCLQGQILLGDKGVVLGSGNIMASNGIIHMVEGLLVPPSILPILPHRCDTTLSSILMVRTLRPRGRAHTAAVCVRVCLSCGLSAHTLSDFVPGVCDVTDV